MSNNKAREVNSPLIKQLIHETSPEELAKIDAEMTNNKQQTALSFFLMGLIDLEIGKDISTDKATELHHLFDKAKKMQKELTIRFALFYAYGQDNVSEHLRTQIEKWYDKIYEGGEQ
jgi:hypothetical protein